MRSNVPIHGRSTHIFSGTAKATALRTNPPDGCGIDHASSKPTYFVFAIYGQFFRVSIQLYVSGGWWRNGGRSGKGNWGEGKLALAIMSSKLMSRLQRVVINQGQVDWLMRNILRINLTTPKLIKGSLSSAPAKTVAAVVFAPAVRLRQHLLDGFQTEEN